MCWTELIVMTFETSKIMKLNRDIKGKGNILQWWVLLPIWPNGYCVSLSKNRMKTNCYHLGKPMTIMMNEHFFLSVLPSQKSLLKAFSPPSLSLLAFPPHPIPHCVINNVKTAQSGLICMGQTLANGPACSRHPSSNLVNRSTWSGVID